MRSTAVRHAARPPPVAVAGADVVGEDAGVLADACGVDGCVGDCVGCAGALGVAVTVWVTVVTGAGWLGDELQAASSDVTATAPVSHATRCTRPDVFAGIARLTLLIAADWMRRMRALGRVAVDMTGSFVRRRGRYKESAGLPLWLAPVNCLVKATCGED